MSSLSRSESLLSGSSEAIVSSSGVLVLTTAPTIRLVLESTKQKRRGRALSSALCSSEERQFRIHTSDDDTSMSYPPSMSCPVTDIRTQRTISSRLHERLHLFRTLVTQALPSGPSCVPSRRTTLLTWSSK